MRKGFWTLAAAALAAGLAGCFDGSSENPGSSSRQDAEARPKLLLVDLDETEAEGLSLLPASGTAATKAKESRWSRDSLYTAQNDTLYWCLSDSSTQMTRDTASLIIERAFLKWKPYLPFQIVETDSVNRANIVIKFKRTPGFYGKKRKYTYWTKKKAPGVYNVLPGFAFDPLKSSRGLGFDSIGDIYVNDLIAWDSISGGAAETTADTLPVDTLNWQDGNGKVALLGTLNTKTTLTETMTRLVGHSLGLAFDRTRDADSNVMKEGGPGIGTGALGNNDVIYITSIYNLPFQLIYGHTTPAFGDYLSSACDSTFRRLLGRALNAKNKALCVELKKKMKANKLPRNDSAGRFSWKFEYRDMLYALGRDSAALNAAGRRDSAWMRRIDSLFVDHDTLVWASDSALLAGIDTSLATRSAKLETYLKSNWFDSLWIHHVYDRTRIGIYVPGITAFATPLRDSTRRKTADDMLIDALNSNNYYRGNASEFIDSVFKHLTGSLPTTAIKNNWKAVLD